MSEEKTEFFRWTRDKHNAFAKMVMRLLGTKLPQTGGTITGPVVMDFPPTQTGDEPVLTFKVKYNETSVQQVWRIKVCSHVDIVYFAKNNSNLFGICPSLGIFPANPNNKNFTLGYWGSPWPMVYAKKLNNGNDIEIPTKAGTLALVSDIEDILRKHNLIPQTN